VEKSPEDSSAFLLLCVGLISTRRSSAFTTNKFTGIRPDVSLLNGAYYRLHRWLYDRLHLGP
jgi:hypothetical protein